VSDSGNSSPGDLSHKVSIQPRLSNHQTQNRSPEKEADYAVLLTQLAKVLEDFRGEKPSAAELNDMVRELPRLKQTGHIPLHSQPREGKRRRRRRKTSHDSEPSEIEKYLPGTRRRESQKRKLFILCAAVVGVFIFSNYSTAKFFYRSGVSEGMRRGLEANPQAEKIDPKDKKTLPKN
jgi:hypothetical protein